MKCLDLLKKLNCENLETKMAGGLETTTGLPENQIVCSHGDGCVLSDELQALYSLKEE